MTNERKLADTPAQSKNQSTPIGDILFTLSIAALLGSLAAWASHSGQGDTNSAYFAFMVPGLLLTTSSILFVVFAIVRQSYWPFVALALMLLLRYII